MRACIDVCRQGDEQVDATLAALRGEVQQLRSSQDTTRQGLINKHEAQLVSWMLNWV